MTLPPSHLPDIARPCLYSFGQILDWKRCTTAILAYRCNHIATPARIAVVNTGSHSHSRYICQGTKMQANPIPWSTSTEYARSFTSSTLVREGFLSWPLTAEFEKTASIVTYVSGPYSTLLSRILELCLGSCFRSPLSWLVECSVNCVVNRCFWRSFMLLMQSSGPMQQSILKFVRSTW